MTEQSPHVLTVSPSVCCELSLVKHVQRTGCGEERAGHVWFHSSLHCSLGLAGEQHLADGYVGNLIKWWEVDS